MTEKQKVITDPQALMVVNFIDSVRAAIANVSVANLYDQ